LIFRVTYRKPLSLLAVCAAVSCLTFASAAGGSSAGSGSIEGAVTAEGGAPLAGAWVCAYRTDDESFEERCARTDGDGHYALKGLAGGAYKVEFWSEATEPSYAGEYYDDELTWEEADEVDVNEGAAVTGIDAELAKGATIEGEVRAPSLGRPLEEWEALVCAFQSSPGVVGCAPTQAGGLYTLSGLPAREYKIQFLPESFSDNLLNQFYDHKSEWAKADSLVLAKGETRTEVDADLEPGAGIQGKVYSADTGASLAGIPVCVLNEESALEEWWPLACEPTRSDGSYRLFGLDSDSYKVVFSPEFKDYFGESVGEEEDDGYFTRYYDEKTTLAAADQLALTPPEVRGGIDAHLLSESRTSMPVTPTAPPLLVTTRPHRRPSHCRPGFRRRKVAGKRRCVKIHKHRRHHRGHRKTA
jgi:hypothetical protein